MTKPTASLTSKQRAMLAAAATGRRMAARDVAKLDRLGLLIREPGSGWCLLTVAGRALLEERASRPLHD